MNRNSDDDRINKYNALNRELSAELFRKRCELSLEQRLTELYKQNLHETLSENHNLKTNLKARKTKYSQLHKFAEETIELNRICYNNLHNLLETDLEEPQSEEKHSCQQQLAEQSPTEQHSFQQQPQHEQEQVNNKDVASTFNAASAGPSGSIDIAHPGTSESTNYPVDQQDSDHDDDGSVNMDLTIQPKYDGNMCLFLIYSLKIHNDFPH